MAQPLVATADKILKEPMSHRQQNTVREDKRHDNFLQLASSIFTVEGDGGKGESPFIHTRVELSDADYQRLLKHVALCWSVFNDL